MRGGLTRCGEVLLGAGRSLLQRGFVFASLQWCACAAAVIGSGAMPWVLGSGAPAGEWVRLPPRFGPGVEARWLKGKGEKGLEFRVGTRRLLGALDGEYRRFRWAREDGNGQYSVQSGRLWVWLREGRRLGDVRWQAHHETRKKGGLLHVKLGGRVRGTAVGPHAKEHGAEGGRARAASYAKKKTLTENRLAAMQAGKARPPPHCCRLLGPQGSPQKVTQVIQLKGKLHSGPVAEASRKTTTSHVTSVFFKDGANHFRVQCGSFDCRFWRQASFLRAGQLRRGLGL